MPSREARQSAYQYGKSSEALAADYCLARGDEILAKNFRIRRGEIDLILRHGQVLVFLEVKARMPGSQIHPAYSIGQYKQRRLGLAARFFLAKNPYVLEKVQEMRFDLLVLTGCRVSEYREGIFFWTKE